MTSRRCPSVVTPGDRGADVPAAPDRSGRGVHAAQRPARLGQQEDATHDDRWQVDGDGESLAPAVPAPSELDRLGDVVGDDECHRVDEAHRRRGGGDPRRPHRTRPVAGSTASTRCSTRGSSTMPGRVATGADGSPTSCSQRVVPRAGSRPWRCPSAVHTTTTAAPSPPTVSTGGTATGVASPARHRTAPVGPCRRTTASSAGTSRSPPVATGRPVTGPGQRHCTASDVRGGTCGAGVSSAHSQTASVTPRSHAGNSTSPVKPSAPGGADGAEAGVGVSVGAGGS